MSCIQLLCGGLDKINKLNAIHVVDYFCVEVVRLSYMSNLSGFGGHYLELTTLDDLYPVFSWRE